jgi:hypothetical protein
VSGREFVLTSVRPKKLRQVAHELWEEEGCKSESDFIEIWKGIHPRKGWDPEQFVFVHEFEQVKTAKDLFSDQRVIETPPQRAQEGIEA